MKKLYLGQLMENYHIEDSVEEGGINLIHAYAGSGKTSYVLDMISKSEENLFGENDNQFFYICDTKLLKQQFKGEYEVKKANIDGVEVEQLYKVGKHGEYIPMSCHIMTYYGWLYFMKVNKNIESKYSFKTFIFDECHVLAQNIVNYSDYDEEEVIEYIDLILGSYSTIIAMSATPSKFNGLMIDNGFTVNDLLQGYKDELRQYASNKVIKYNEKPSQLLTHIPFKKCAIYWCGSIKELKKEVENIRELGLNVNYIVADDNCEQEQLALKEYIVKNNNVPTEYDVIIFNKSMGTGVNILDKNNEFDTFITYATKHEYLDYDDIYQARMRIRHDIEVEYQFTKAHDIKREDKKDMKLQHDTEKRMALIKSVLGQKLSTKEFKALATELNFKTQTRKTNMKPYDEIRTLGYTVQEPTNSKRYTLISK